MNEFLEMKPGETEADVRRYNADLANGLGNLVSRVVKLAQNLEYKPPKYDVKGLEESVEKMELGIALKSIWLSIKTANQSIEENKPWELLKTDKKKFEEVMVGLMQNVAIIQQQLMPFMPDTSEKIKTALETKKVTPLFQRIK